jgi:hypothetical protein
MPDERVHIRLRTRTVILPTLPAISRAHQTAELDTDQQQTRIMRAGRDPAHMRRPRPRRKTPTRPRRQLQQRLQLPPAPPAILTPEQPARLRPHVHRTVHHADRNREHPRLRQPAIDPAPATIHAPAHTPRPQPRIHRLAIDRQTLRTTPGQEQLHHPAVTRLIHTDNPITGRPIQPHHHPSVRTRPCSTAAPHPPTAQLNQRFGRGPLRAREGVDGSSPSEGSVNQLMDARNHVRVSPRARPTNRHAVGRTAAAR